MRDRESLNAADRAQLSECGIPLAEAERQLALLAGVDRGSEAKPATRLLRPATVGDGIERIREGEGSDLCLLYTSPSPRD